MAMGQFSDRKSLRDIIDGKSHRLYHLGSAKLSRSNLSRINEDKSHQLYEALAGKLSSRCQKNAPKHNIKFKNKLYSLDASTIDLCLSVFSWAKFCSIKSAVKLHIDLNHNGLIPEFVTKTEVNTSDINVGRTLQFPKGNIVAIDRGYNDYKWFNQLTEKGIFFVTRLKVNAKYHIVERHGVLKNKGLTCDKTIKFIGI